MNKIVKRYPNPLYNKITLKNELNNYSNKSIFQYITRNTAEKILKKKYISFRSNYWLIRKKNKDSHVISLITNNCEILHFKIDNIDNGSISYFKVNTVRLYLPSNIHQVIKILTICPATSYLLSGHFSPLLKGECINPN